MTLPVQFEPSFAQTDLLRGALGQFATGVTVITCNSHNTPTAMTVNSFASVSLDPALILWSIARSSKRFDAFFAADAFSIHVLADDQKDLCIRFAKNGNDFTGLELAHSPITHAPILTKCLARFDCVSHQKHDGGDHVIMVGRIANVVQNEGKPLVFAQGNYGPPSAQAI